MKNLHKSPLLSCLAGLAGLLLLAGPARADDPVDATRSTAHDARRGVKRGAHRVAESLCTGTKAECAERKLKNRGKEAKDKVADKVDEAKEKAR